METYFMETGNAFEGERNRVGIGVIFTPIAENVNH